MNMVNASASSYIDIEIQSQQLPKPQEPTVSPRPGEKTTSGWPAVDRPGRCFAVLAALLLFTFASRSEPATAGSTVGFLIVAPDRGFLGNQEIRAVFDDFAQRYAPAALAFVGRDDNGMGSEYSDYLSRALADLEHGGATDIVAIPLFVSSSDPVLQKVVTHLPAYGRTGTLRWAEPMVESHLIRQILLDRAMAASRDPEQERLLLVGFGATDETGENAMRRDLERYLAYIARYLSFRETRAVLYYDRSAPDAEKKNKAADQVIVEAAAKKGRTLVILATIGPKFDQTMALTRWFGDKLRDWDVAYVAEDLLPHPNVLLWLQKTANAFLPVSPAEIGVVIMPHGATQPWNDAVERAIAPLHSRYRIEMAYGMGDPTVIQQAVQRLERQGIRRIVFVRLYALAHHLKDHIEYILGLSDSLEPDGRTAAHDRGLTPPAQIRSAALFATFGGYEEDPGIVEALHARIQEISRDPSQEIVILVAHGDKRDEDNAHWLSIMRAHIERLKRDPHCAKLKAILAATVREDWPDLREHAVAEVRHLIEAHAKTGRVLVIADRLYGAGPYRKFFDGLDYVLNDKGLVHPALTHWLEAGINQAISVLTRPVSAVDRVAKP
jgi:sirohydrochlorin ferrochelatase